MRKIKQNDTSITLEQIQNLKKFIQGTDDVYLDKESLDMLCLLREFLKCNNEVIENEKTYSLKGGK